MAGSVSGYSQRIHGIIMWRRRATMWLTEKTNLNDLEKPVYSTQMIFLPHERGIAMSSNPANKKLATKIKDLELKPAAYEKGADPQLISEGFRRLANRSRDIIYQYNLTTRQFLFVNKTGLEFYGIDVEGGREVTAKSVMSSIYPEDWDKVKKARDESLAPGSTGGDMEYRQIRPDGSLHWMHDQWIIIMDETGNPVTIEGIVRDITDRKLAEEALRESENRYRDLSIIDDLTQLYNSRHFYHQLKMEIDRVDRYGQPLTLLLLDLDDFKRFNDAYGHIEGDQTLLRLGQVVKRCLRQTDSAYRYGGEEFTILLPMTTDRDGAVTAERIRMEFKKETFSPVPGQDVHVTVSIGLAQYKPQEDMKVFVHRVDQLMYQGKKNGKDRVCCEP